MTNPTNDQLILIAGEPATGKSASLMNIKGKDKWYYFNTESGKKLPFKNDFREIIITDPKAVLNYMDQLTANIDKVNGVIIDSVSFLMEQYETRYIYNSTDSRGAWGDYQQFFKQLLQDKIANFKKPVIITAHNRTERDGDSLVNSKTSVPVKGALKNIGIEAYFSLIVVSKIVSLVDLEPYQSELLNITPDDELVGYKHVFQTRVTKDTVGINIRSPMGMFTPAQSFMDNDTQLLLDWVNKYYGV